MSTLQNNKDIISALKNNAGNYESKFIKTNKVDYEFIPNELYIASIAGHQAVIHETKHKHDKYLELIEVCTIKLLDESFSRDSLRAVCHIDASTNTITFSFDTYDVFVRNNHYIDVSNCDNKSINDNSNSESKNYDLDSDEFVIQIMQKANDIKDKNELVDYLTSRVLTKSLTDRAQIMMPAVKREDLTHNKHFYLDKRQTLADLQNIVKIEITYVRGNVIFYKEEGSDTEDYFAADSVAVKLNMIEPVEYETNLNPKYFNVVSKMGMTKITYKH